ncbi:vacuolar-sorting protein snf8 [Stylonychia lemnae]|uniref:Vacuolar-sorting protein snf8 n=1 Tax=Stylonychia lemnae TaxID=5949 RepID=A0A078AXL5_STYLE|nr:vacuolar-sorting protein snf8 [Stylonychia lemnae]|eukprot:CDW85543.1 vacuolar-sorting protein snf8 [Stylonychia lemnae]
MRRGVGIAGVKQNLAVQQKLKEVGQEIEKTQLEEMNKQLSEFKNHLENFALKHRKEINQNPVFRNQFLKMCKEIGVDPLSLNICIALRKKNGGFLEENECLTLLKKIRSSKAEEVTLKDLRKAVESLHKLGSEFKIIHTGSKRVICSSSVELSQDNLTIMQLAEENNGWITFTKLREKISTFNQHDRFQRAIDQLIKEGLAWVDEQSLQDNNASKGVFAKNAEDQGKCYWFPSLMENKQKNKEEAEDLALIGRQ